MCCILSHGIFWDPSVCTWHGWWVQIIHHLVPHTLFSQSLLLQLILCLILASLLERCPVIQVKLIYCPKLGILLDIFQKSKWSETDLLYNFLLIKSALTSVIMFFLGYSCTCCPRESCQCGEKNIKMEGY